MHKLKTDFLFKEYEECFEQLRFYDSRSTSLLRYLFSLTSAVATAQFAIYKFTYSFDKAFYGCQAFLSLIVFVAVALIFMSMVQNRLYFVLTARQLNAVRRFFVDIDPDDGFRNQLYTSTDFPAHKPSSVHTFHLVGAGLLCGLYAGSFTFAMLHDLEVCIPTVIGVLIVALTVTVLSCAGAFKYLKAVGDRPADEAVHGERATTQQENSVGEG